MNETQEKDNVAAIVLAAGLGTRMKSDLPKVLHNVAGKPMIELVLTMLNQAGVNDICLVLGGGLEPFSEVFGGFPGVNVCIQQERMGTGHAVAAAADSFFGVSCPAYSTSKLVKGTPFKNRQIVVCYGDVPAIPADLLRDFLDKCLFAKTGLAVLGMEVPDPKGYGRLLVKNDFLEKIVEDKDASPKQREITLCNSGVVFATTSVLFDLLQKITPANAQGEYYLTDCFGLASTRGTPGFVYRTNDWRAFSGINDRRQLSEVERYLVDKKINELMKEGVTIHSPSSVYIELDVSIGPDTVIGPNVSVFGNTVIGRGCYINANAVIVSSEIEDKAEIGESSVITNYLVKSEKIVSPLSKLGS